MKIIIDTREKHAWAFPCEVAETSRGTLPTGDYALEGDPFFAIERKSLDDFVGTIASEWERFQREIERMQFYPAIVIIVEANFADIINHAYNHPSISPSFVLKRTAELVFLRACVLFCDNPISAAGMAYKIFVEREKFLKKEGEL